MSYTKQDWNKFVWKEGQANLQDMLNHMEDGIANAGGGSGAEYTAGHGIKIENNEISTDVDVAADVEYVDASITSTMLYIDQQDRSEHAGRVAGDELLQDAIDKKQDKLTAGENISINEENVISAEGGLPEGAEDGDILAFETEKEIEPITAGHTYTLKKEYKLSDMPQPADEDHYVSNYFLKLGQKINSLRFNFDKIVEVMSKYIDGYRHNIITPFYIDHDYDGDDQDILRTLNEVSDLVSVYFGSISDGARWGADPVQDPGKVYVTGPHRFPGGLWINVTDETIQFSDDTIVEPKSVYIVNDRINVFKKLDNSIDLIEQTITTLISMGNLPEDAYDLFKQYCYVTFDTSHSDEDFDYCVNPVDQQMYIIDDKQVESPFMFGWREDFESIFVWLINDNNDGLIYAFPGDEAGYTGWLKFNDEEGTVQPYTGSLDVTIPENYILYGLDELQDIEFLFEKKETPIEGSEKAKWIKNPVPSYTENDVGKSLVVTKTGGEVKLGIPLKLKKSYTIDEVIVYLGGENGKGYLDMDTPFGITIGNFGPALMLGTDPQSMCGYILYGYMFAASGLVSTDGWYIPDGTSEEPAFIPATPPETITLPLNMDIEEYGENLSSIQDLAFFFDLGEVEIKTEWKSNIDNRIPAPPSSDGVYTLQCTIVDGVATYTWIQQQNASGNSF